MTKIEKGFLYGLISVMLFHTIFNYKIEGITSIIKFIIGIVLYIIPIILNLLFKNKMTPSIRYIYYVFIFFAYYIGYIANGYDWTNYDTIVHFTSGILSSFLSLILLIKFKKFQNKNEIFNILFIISTVLAVACFWEIIEFSIDQIFNLNMQSVETGVSDTMKDIMVASVGSVLFIIWYLYEKITSTNLFITKFIREVRDLYER